MPHGYITIGPIYIHRHYTWETRWAWERGRCHERILRIPILHWALEIHGPGKSYLELVDAPKYLNNTDWIIDEFDSSFNDLAIASLKYHMHHSVAVCENPNKYQNLIDRLSEEEPGTTAEEHAAIETWDIVDRSDPQYGKDGKIIGYRVPPSTPEASAAFKTWEVRCAAHRKRILQARHDFVDLMPELWS